MSTESYRALVLADIHSNSWALEAVLNDADKHGPYDTILCAGDMVGYGPDPNGCIDRLRDRGAVCIAGNHDVAIVDGDVSEFNVPAYLALVSNKADLTVSSRRFLDGLSTEPYVDPEGRFAMVHGSFAGRIDGDMEGRYERIYVLEENGAFRAMSPLRFPLEKGFKQVGLGILGHTHVPMYAHGFIQFSESGGATAFGVSAYSHFREVGGTSDSLWSRVKLTPKNVLSLEVPADTRFFKMLFNPGSVGQPRDGCSNACYGVVTWKKEGEEDKVILEFRHVPYDISKVRKAVKAKGLPDILWQRLYLGQ